MMQSELMDQRLSGLLAECVRCGASDLHLSADAQVRMRVDGDLLVLDRQRYSALETGEMVSSLLSAGQREALERASCVDVAFSVSGVRFRGHVFKERKGLAMAARKLDSRFKTLEELCLPSQLTELARLPNGLVLFTGPTGSGKSTTLASLLDQINRERACHILTIEDPIEYVHENRLGLVHQRELHRDVGSFAEAVRASLREDPDVVLVGEMRDAETMRAAIMVAETGHLVFSTLHCGNTAGALDRIMGAFPAAEQESLCQQLSMTLRAVVAQHLLPRAESARGGRTPAVEILVVTKAVANLIRNHKSEQIYTMMESGAEHGMQTLEQSLAELTVAGTINREIAQAAASDLRALEQRLKMMSEDMAGAGCRAASQSQPVLPTITARC